jgi:H+/Cl- antiporter ClcA
MDRFLDNPTSAISPQPNVTPLTLPLRFWLMLLLTGIFAGLAGGALMKLLHTVEHLAWAYRSPEVFLQAVSRASPLRKIINLTLAGMVVAITGLIFRRAFGKAGGDAEGAVWFGSGKIESLPAACRAIASIISVGLGTSLGRESPIKQMGGAIASQLAEIAGLPPDQMRLLVASGIGAGMAAAYNVPLGGALFAAEVLLGSVSIQTILPALIASVTATTASWVFLPIEPVYRVPEFPMSWSLLVWSILAGPMLGLASVLVVKAIAWGERSHSTGTWSFVKPILGLSLMGALCIAFPQLPGNGKDTVQLAFSDAFPLSLLFALPVLKLISTAGCLRCGATGGLFTPTMTIGALLGGALGHCWSRLWPNPNAGSYAIAGAAAVLAAATLGPVSSLVLVLELTRHADATMVPILFATSGALLVARMFGSQSIYSARAMKE